MTPLICRQEDRRHAVRKADLNGLDFVEVDPNDRSRLTVWFLGKAPEDGLRPENVVILGGQRSRGLRVTRVEIRHNKDMAEDDCTVVTLDGVDDLSTYRLCLRELDEAGRPTEQPLQGFDPRYACAEFRFDAGCPSELDCKSEPVCLPEPREAPELHYVARDYASFRQLLLDRLSLIMPGWRERNAPDVGITLVEVLAYLGDHLSYYQDAVATEAYLETARERISVRRHARLVDYAMHEGCNARAWIVLETSQSKLSLDPETFWFRTGSGATALPMLRAEDLANESARVDPALAFEPIVEGGTAEILVRASRNEILIHTWGDSECCLPKGSTCADLLDPGQTPERPREQPPGKYSPAQEAVVKEVEPSPPPPRHVLDLKPCDVLVFEEVKGPRTGTPAAADPGHRHAVRLVRAEPSQDPLTGDPVWHVEWGPEDALPFPVCVSSVSPAPECEPIRNVTVVRGNVVLVDHGTRFEEGLEPVPCRIRTPPCCDECEPTEVTIEAGPFAPVLDRPELTHRVPPAPCRQPELCDAERITSAASSLRQDPRAARPQIALDGIAADSDCVVPFDHEDLRDPARLAKTLGPDATGSRRRLRDQLRGTTVERLDEWLGGKSTTTASDLARALREDLSRLVERWEATTHLLDCDPEDRHFVVEVDDERRAHIRFGQGTFGCRPSAGTAFRATYRLGNGSSGNVGPESINQIVFRTEYPSGASIRARNPMPAIGGKDPEPVGEVKAYAPHAFRRVLERAVTATDYAAIVDRDFEAQVQRAAATVRWTGSHPEVLVAIDPRDASRGDERLLCEIERHLDTYRRIGHDVAVMWARYVSLLVTLTICVRPGHLKGHVKASLLEALGSRRRRDGGLGFFHPDNLSFGEGVQASAIVAAAQAVEGVESVSLERFERLYEGPNGEIEEGVLPLGPLEVARLDNVPNWPEHGRLELKMGGGR
jgi:hypothetical protein